MREPPQCNFSLEGVDGTIEFIASPITTDDIGVIEPGEEGKFLIRRTSRFKVQVLLFGDEKNVEDIRCVLILGETELIAKPEEEALWFTIPRWRDESSGKDYESFCVPSEKVNSFLQKIHMRFEKERQSIS